MLLRMLRDTTLVAYLQQMHQLVLQQGSPGYVVPVAPNSGWGPADQEPHEASGDAPLMHLQCRNGSGTSVCMRSPAECLCTSAPPSMSCIIIRLRLDVGASDQTVKAHLHLCRLCSRGSC